jgi:hypothetical protein
MLLAARAGQQLGDWWMLAIGGIAAAGGWLLAVKVLRHPIAAEIEHWLKWPASKMSWSEDGK